MISLILSTQEALAAENREWWGLEKYEGDTEQSCSSF